MRSLIKYAFITLLTFGCAKKEELQFNSSEKFENELIELQNFFNVPGIAVSVIKEDKTIYQNYLGYSDLESQTKLDSTYVFPIASITKVFSGVLMMKLVEQQKISLDEPIQKYVPQMNVPDSILVKHVLSHTSQGEVGKQFYYSSRFGILTAIIEKASGKSFKEYMTSEIFKPLALQNTYLLKDTVQISQNNLKIPSPYILDNGIEKGFIDFGYSSSAGIITDLNDLKTFSLAFDHNKLISERSKNLMLSGVNENLPYGYGVFNQQFDDLKLVWAYGQYDCYSSLLLKVPSRNITLVLLANNNLLSDPARLIYGDVTTSLFALSFIKNYIYQIEDMPLLESEESGKTKGDYKNENFYTRKLLAQALASSFMARFETKKMQTSSMLLEKVFSESPDYLEYADLNLLHNLTFLKDVAFYKELGEFNQFDEKIEAIGAKVLKEDPENPYGHVYMGVYYDRKGDINRARYHFESIVNADNFSKNWYTTEAKNWIETHKN
ncbi:serine hydrolase domain-containing protein [Aquimarina algiphila]|uniref:serine hydrolase domain-containing protein n=1 Tax=Aquimarina algiphila TaxID=2047982 RepID=UPI00232C92A0|nr:serine hydrolase domain-containing protein [Aquimarina algiphila]